MQFTVDIIVIVIACAAIGISIAALVNKPKDHFIYPNYPFCKEGINDHFCIAATPETNSAQAQTCTPGQYFRQDGIFGQCLSEPPCDPPCVTYKKPDFNIWSPTGNGMIPYGTC